VDLDPRGGKKQVLVSRMQHQRTPGGLVEDSSDDPAVNDARVAAVRLGHRQPGVYLPTLVIFFENDLEAERVL
jgi:hypothetical protein